MSRPILKTENLKKKIGSRTIVSDISLELSEGEIFGFLGPNGAGKTTTIKMITGLSRITGGNIYIDGHSVKSEYKAAMRHMGCIVENPEMYKYMSGYDNLKLFARMYGKADKKRLYELAGTVGLENAIKDKVKTYSLGMKQRLGIAQALLSNPKLLVLDEPTNGLDPAGIKEVRELLKALAKEQKLTVFVSSHILAEMQQMCDRVSIINKGRIVTTKPVGELVFMSKGGSGMLLCETGDDEKASSLLSGAGFEATAGQGGLHVAAGREKVPEIVSLLYEAGVKIYGLSRQETGSLEDIFMQLTEEGK
jgi:ABC-2 type transport system ATP-binding protein